MASHETKETLGPGPMCPVDPTSIYFWLNLALLPRNEDENMPRKSRIFSTFMLIAAQKMSRFYPLIRPQVCQEKFQCWIQDFPLEGAPSHWKGTDLQRGHFWRKHM